LTSLKFNPIKKDRLFYDQFEYCISFHLDEVSCLRVLDHNKINDVIERRKQWREISQQRWLNGRQRHGIIMSRRHRDITEKTIQDLHALARVLLQTTYKFKLVVSVQQGYVYTNDKTLIDQLSCMPELSLKTYSQAVVNRPKNTIQLKNSNYKFRSYFKIEKLTGSQKDLLCNFLTNQTNQVRLSSALSKWFAQPYNRTQDYFFIDHKDMTWLTMLSLVHPGLIRKTMHIISAK
jgi:hypothetical protein